MPPCVDRAPCTHAGMSRIPIAGSGAISQPSRSLNAHAEARCPAIRVMSCSVSSSEAWRRSIIAMRSVVMREVANRAPNCSWKAPESAASAGCPCDDRGDDGTDARSVRGRCCACHGETYMRCCSQRNRIQGIVKAVATIVTVMMMGRVCMVRMVFLQCHGRNIAVGLAMWQVWPCNQSGRAVGLTAWLIWTCCRSGHAIGLTANRW